MRLYELTDTYAELLMQFEEEENPEKKAEILDAITNVEDDISAKAENYARIVKNAESDIETLAAEIRRLQAKKKTAENVVSRVKENLHFAMEIAGATSIKTSIGKWRVQQNPPRVEVVDVSKVPARFLIEKEPDVDKRAMLNEFRITGEVFDGVEIRRESGVRFS